MFFFFKAADCNETKAFIPTSKTTFIILIATMVPAVLGGGLEKGTTVIGPALLTFVRLIDSRIHGVCHYSQRGYSAGPAIIKELIMWRSELETGPCSTKT